MARGRSLYHTTSSRMASPPQAIPISGSFRPNHSENYDPFPSGTPGHSTPDIRNNLRTQFSGSPPIPNIPAWGTPSSQNRSGTPNRQGTPNLRAGTPHRSGTPNNLPLPGPIAVASSPQVRVGLLSAKRPAADTPSGTGDHTPLDLEGLDEEEAARVLRKHLVSKDERQVNAAESSEQEGAASSSDREVSRQSSTAFPRPAPRREEPEDDQFDVEYGVPGADVT